MSEYRLFKVIRTKGQKYFDIEYVRDVVTCGECKYSEKTSSPITALWCKRFGLEDMAVEADDFCSYGERKDNE